MDKMIASPGADRAQAASHADAGALEEADSAIIFRPPVAEDGPAITDLIAACPPLDRNSAYCNLIQCTHFADSCVVAQRAGCIVGWISAHRPPSEPDRVFVWQVAVHSDARGLGLGGRMLREVIARPAHEGATHMITTVTEDNAASWAMFESFARRYAMTVEKSVLFDRDRHFAGRHNTEWQAEIGPLPTTI